jgi:hypothetical protein
VYGEFLMESIDIFTEQAEYIPQVSFENWTIKHHDESTIIRKLSQGGAKLITGPRGCGKTTLMLKTYYNLVKLRTSPTLAVYVNFKSSLKLEPLYKHNANAAFWFNQWLLFKVLQGLHQSLIFITDNKDLLGFTISHVDKIVSLLEMGRVDLINDISDQLSIASLVSLIDRVLSDTQKSRCVLLLDDAGHAFSSEQQQDFFEFFREVKTKTISPKAAIYPGVTTYSSSFHVGHDAEEIDVWMKPSSSGYLEFMHSILKSRFSGEIYEDLSKDKNLLDLICYAAYGIPRSLLNIISIFYKDDEEHGDETRILDYNHANVLKAIKKCFDSTYQIYDSLKIKLPMYAGFIDVGASFFERCLTTVKEFNKGGDPYRQSTIIAIKRPLIPELSRVIGFFQYAGILLPQGISSRGEKGVYELYELHYAAIIDRNVFFSRRTISSESYCIAFKNRPNHHYPRLTTESLLETETASALFVLALPPCDVCKTPRLFDYAKFCTNCGSKLKEVSVFENIVNQDIINLPITARRAASIKESSRISTIKDILMDHDNKELRSVPMIGPTWAYRIRSYAEEFIA